MAAKSDVDPREGALMHGKALKIYMCDLTHDTVVLVSDTIPINIGFVGGYARKLYGRALDIRFFKYPQSAIAAIEKAPPDVLALSNYSWNSNLSEHIAKLAKTRNPAVVTVQGGTNFPHKTPQQLEFLQTRPSTDFYVELEAEVSFSELIGRVLACRDQGREFLFDRAIPGCVYIHPDSRHSKNPLLVKGELPPRIRDLDDIPSPYLTGAMDGFFDGRLTPFLETNRGCPFKCSFCHTGAEYFQKTTLFSLDRIKEEIAYIGPRAAEHRVANLHIADTNFGMYPRDREICEALLESQKRHGWPKQIMSTTGKNNKERVIEITKIMGNTFSVNMSVQSMDYSVLHNIKRDNIKLDDYKKINEHLNQEGRSTKGEVIIGLPGETRESFVRGIEQIVAAGVSSVCSYSLMLLHGTDFKDPEYRREFDIRGKYRIVPLDFGEYAGERVFDTEEVGISTNSMSFDDYVWIRGLSLFVESMHNNRPYEEIVRYGVEQGLQRFDIIRRCYDSLETAPPPVRNIVQDFLTETKSELWDSEQELVEFFSRDENYSRLRGGEAGGNLIYKYKAISLASCSADWADYIGAVIKRLLAESAAKSAEGVEDEIDLLVQYVKNKLAGLLQKDGDLSPRSLVSRYDVSAWLRNTDGGLLSAFVARDPIVYVFEYTEEQISVIQDYFRRYGSDPNGLSKIVTRVSNVESLFRRIRTDAGLDEVSTEARKDSFIRYTLSN